MAVALRRGTGNSLLLIDEFGKGTVMVGFFTSHLTVYFLTKVKIVTIQASSRFIRLVKPEELSQFAGLSASKISMNFSGNRFCIAKIVVKLLDSEGQR